MTNTQFLRHFRKTLLGQEGVAFFEIEKLLKTRDPIPLGALREVYMDGQALFFKFTERLVGVFFSPIFAISVVRKRGPNKWESIGICSSLNIGADHLNK